MCACGSVCLLCSCVHLCCEPVLAGPAAVCHLVSRASGRFTLNLTDLLPPVPCPPPHPWSRRPVLGGRGGGREAGQTGWCGWQSALTAPLGLVVGEEASGQACCSFLRLLLLLLPYSPPPPPFLPPSLPPSFSLHCSER